MTIIRGNGAERIAARNAEIAERERGKAFMQHMLTEQFRQALDASPEYQKACAAADAAREVREVTDRAAAEAEAVVEEAQRVSSAIYFQIRRTIEGLR